MRIQKADMDGVDLLLYLRGSFPYFYSRKIESPNKSHAVISIFNACKFKNSDLL